MGFVGKMDGSRPFLSLQLSLLRPFRFKVLLVLFGKCLIQILCSEAMFAGFIFASVQTNSSVSEEQRIANLINGGIYFVF